MSLRIPSLFSSSSEERQGRPPSLRASCNGSFTRPLSQWARPYSPASCTKAHFGSTPATSFAPLRPMPIRLRRAEGASAPPRLARVDSLTLHRRRLSTEPEVMMPPTTKARRSDAVTDWVPGPARAWGGICFGVARGQPARLASRATACEASLAPTPLSLALAHPPHTRTPNTACLPHSR
jgi:hypothetical protein